MLRVGGKENLGSIPDRGQKFLTPVLPTLLSLRLCLLWRSDRGMKLTILLQLVLKLRIRGAIPPLPLMTLMCGV
jgi:hypothetical protein